MFRSVNKFTDFVVTCSYMGLRRTKRVYSKQVLNLSANVFLCLHLSNWIINGAAKNATKYKFYLNKLNDNWNGHVFTLIFPRNKHKKLLNFGRKMNEEEKAERPKNRLRCLSRWVLDHQTDFLIFSFFFLKSFRTRKDADGMWSEGINEILGHPRCEGEELIPILGDLLKADPIVPTCRTAGDFLSPIIAKNGCDVANKPYLTYTPVTTRFQIRIQFNLLAFVVTWRSLAMHRIDCCNEKREKNENQKTKISNEWRPWNRINCLLSVSRRYSNYIIRRLKVTSYCDKLSPVARWR